jgi:hypothetical protein
VLCQLSYTHHPHAYGRRVLPSRQSDHHIQRAIWTPVDVGARQKGFEPLTRGLEGRCSFP